MPSPNDIPRSGGVDSAQQGTEPDWDPVYLHSRREALVVIILFTIFFIWSLAVCFATGYLEPGEEFTEVDTIFGMPAWSFWGIALPWVVVDVVAIWFCFFFMTNDDLGEADEEAVMHPDGADKHSEPPVLSGKNTEASRTEDSDHA